MLLYQSALPVRGVGGAACHVGASKEQLLCLHQRLQVLFEKLCQQALAGVQGIALQRTLKLVVLKYCKTSKERY